MGKAVLDHPRRAAVSFVVVAGAAAGIAIWALQGADAAQEALPSVKVTKGNVVLAVGGVGRIVQTGADGKPASPGSGTVTDAPANAVYPRISGHLRSVLVTAGQHVDAGQPLAVIDDGGAALAAVRQATLDLEIAQLELQQKQTGDPANGLPPTRAELATARLAVVSARTRLNRLQAPPTAADIAAADAEIRKAEADLAALRVKQPAPSADALKAARAAVTAAQARLDALNAGPDGAAVKAAQADLARAEADLAALERAPQGPLPEEIAAAQRAVATAQDKLTLALASGDPVFVADARLELERARAELAKLQRAPAAPAESELAAARAAVERARAALAKAQAPPATADLATAEADLDRARADLAALQRRQVTALPEAVQAAEQALRAARAKRVQLTKPTRIDLAAARLELSRAETELAVLEQRGGPARGTDIRLADLKVEAARARLTEAQAALAKLRIRSPLDGTVTAVLAVPGSPVDTLTPIASVADLEQLEAIVDLSEFDVAQVRPGLKAVVGVDALGGETVPGKVLFAALAGSNAGGVVTFPVRIALSDSEGLRPGMNVSVRIIVAQRKNVLQLPLDAVTIDEEDNATVMVQTAAGKVVERPVSLGLTSTNNVEVRKGLKPGDRVIIEEAAPAAGEEE